jgi:hypothetical protein
LLPYSLGGFRGANSKETEMRTAEARLRWSSFEWAVTGLLAICAALLGFYVAMMWSYLPAITTTATSSASTKNHAETNAVLSGLKEQQALTNSKLDAIQNELRALNQKAAGAANVTPPPQATPEAAGAPRAGGRLSR